MALLDRRWLIRLLNLYPPYLGAGVRVRASADLCTFDVRMKLTRWNRNYVGTHFGGSLYTMCDPFFMLILFEQLGRDYIVWDKAATVRFRRPGKGTVHARFHIPPEKIAEIRAAADRDGKIEPVFTVEVRDDQGEVIAEVEKLLYVRRKTGEGVRTLCYPAERPIEETPKETPCRNVFSSCPCFSWRSPLPWPPTPC